MNRALSRPLSAVVFILGNLHVLFSVCSNTSIAADSLCN